MSRSLSFECEWIDEPSASDPIECRTWASLRIHAGGRAVTRLWDRTSSAERVSLFVPAFPLAKWVLENWWALLYEPSRSDEIPAADVIPSYHQQGWIRRHCLRAADSGLLLPRAFLYSDGKGVCVNWFADEQGAYARMPGEFPGEGFVRLGYDEAEEGLRAFIRQVIDRIDEMDDPHSARLREDWNAIIAADRDESAFCRAAGRLGLDPYRLDDWPDGVAGLIESGSGNGLESDITADLLEAINIRKPSGAATASAIWAWANSTRTALDLQASPSPHTEPSYSVHPARNGYRIARNIRQSLNGHGHGPLEAVAVAGETMHIPGIRFESRNHLPNREVQAAVGWRNRQEPIIAGPPIEIDANKRFLEARALYLAAFGCHDGPRLLTTAHTWDQKASRAFAAELLAPQAELVARAEGTESLEELGQAVSELANEYRVSTKVIEHQLENAGLILDGE